MPNAMELSPTPKQPLTGKQKGGIAALVGVTAAALLYSVVPREEGTVYVGYLDIAKIPTKCTGDTKDVQVGQRYTVEECRQSLDKQLVAHAKGVMACTPSLADEGRDYQRVAIVSFAYNAGVAAYCNSTAAKHFRARNWAKGCAAMLPWDKARVNGVLRPVKGLTARRQREYALCMKGL